MVVTIIVVCDGLSKAGVKAGGMTEELALLRSAVYDQLGRTERACGGPLVNRSPRPPGTGILTPLGEQLCQQARDYLHPAAPGGPGHAAARQPCR